MSEKELMLNCTKCESFEHAYQQDDDPDNIFRCADCGKKHSEDSIYFVYPDVRYERDGSGELVEDLP